MILCENRVCKHHLDGVCRFAGTVEIDADGECAVQEYERQKVEDVIGHKLYMSYILMGDLLEYSIVEVKYLKGVIELPEVRKSADGVALSDETGRVVWIDSMELVRGEKSIIDIDLMELTSY